MGRKAVRALPVLGAGFLTLAAAAATLHPPLAGASPARPVLTAAGGTFVLSPGREMAGADAPAPAHVHEDARPVAISAPPEG